jgi:hypothetical protein
MAGGECTGGGGRGDARASCASPLGTPLMTSVSYPQSGSESDNIKLADPDTDLPLSLAVTQQLIKISVFFHIPYLIKKSLKSVSGCGSGSVLQI